MLTCVIEKELYKEYQLVLNKIESAIQIIKKYDINKMVDQYDSLYKTLMANC